MKLKDIGNRVDKDYRLHYIKYHQPMDRANSHAVLSGSSYKALQVLATVKTGYKRR